MNAIQLILRVCGKALTRCEGRATAYDREVTRTADETGLRSHVRLSFRASKSAMTIIGQRLCETSR